MCSFFYLLVIYHNKFIVRARFDHASRYNYIHAMIRPVLIQLSNSRDSRSTNHIEWHQNFSIV